jgi:hypothetical protein
MSPPQYIWRKNGSQKGGLPIGLPKPLDGSVGTNGNEPASQFAGIRNRRNLSREKLCKAPVGLVMEYDDLLYYGIRRAWVVSCHCAIVGAFRLRLGFGFDFRVAKDTVPR